jgi:hypothetical protein
VIDPAALQHFAHALYIACGLTSLHFIDEPPGAIPCD